MANKVDFELFDVGTVFNDVRISSEPIISTDGVTVVYPSRLEAMALDPSKIIGNDNLVYEAGQIDFCVDMNKTVHVSAGGAEKGISISERTPRSALVRHAALIMQAALGVDDPLIIDVIDEVNLRHCGLGSSSSLVASTAAAINELYGRPIKPLDLVRYCAQNHGEEIDGNDDKLMPVQCIGGSAVCGHFDGGLIILAGQATPILTSRLNEQLSVVLGVPSNFEHPDSETLMSAEIENLEGFRKSGETHGREIAYRLVHQVMPGLAAGNLLPCKKLIFDYRWGMGSIQNCSFVYPRMNDIADNLRWMGDDEAIKIVSLSSVGPGFFCLTSDTEKAAAAFEDQSMDVYVTSIQNNRYGVMHDE